MEANCGLAPMRGGLEVPIPIGYGNIALRTTPNWAMRARNSPERHLANLPQSP
jgi:hypothetical protein